MRSIRWMLTMMVLVSPVALAQPVEVLLAKMADIQSDPVSEAKAIQEGQIRGRFCFNCHGEDGNSKRTHIPNLAGQNATYLFTQFEKFANGKRTDYVMSQLAKKLTDDERIAIAIYFSKTDVKPREQPVTPDPDGKRLYDSLCFACHGPTAHGSHQYPRIAGQPYEYLELTLMRFKHKDPERKESAMIGVVQNLSEEQLKAVASYVAHMK